MYPTEVYNERAHLNSMMYRENAFNKTLDESSDGENDLMINEFLKTANYRELDINDISPIAPLRPSRGVCNRKYPAKTPSHMD
jgi:hypothetical protein